MVSASRVAIHEVSRLQLRERLQRWASLHVRERRDRDAPQVRLGGTVKIHAVQDRLHGILARILVVELQGANARIELALERLFCLWQIKGIVFRLGDPITGDRTSGGIVVDQCRRARRPDG